MHMHQLVLVAAGPLIILKFEKKIQLFLFTLHLSAPPEFIKSSHALKVPL